MTADPAASRTFPVISCGKCPLSHFSLLTGRGYCNLDEKHRIFSGVSMYPLIPPSWCPLRVGPVTLRLAE